MAYWINVVSKDHVQRGMDGGFTQANHGKDTTLKRLKTGDWIVYYSPKTSYENGQPLQCFTAIGQVASNELYQVEVSPEFHPWRCAMTFYPCNEVPVKPIVDELDFIIDKIHWGHRFRFGMFQISEKDFEFIRSLM